MQQVSRAGGCAAGRQGRWLCRWAGRVVVQQVSRAGGCAAGEQGGWLRSRGGVGEGRCAHTNAHKYISSLAHRVDTPYLISVVCSTQNGSHLFPLSITFTRHL